jgi:hypothetical protein
LTGYIERKAKNGYSDYPEGNDIAGIAVIVFGKAVLHVERRGGSYCGDVSLCYSAKSSLSRSLKQLHQKGLVKKCFPVYERGWIIFDDRNGVKRRYYGVRNKALKATWKDDKGLWVVEWLAFRSLPGGCHVWWMLTERGKDLIETDFIPRLDLSSEHKDPKRESGSQ